MDVESCFYVFGGIALAALALLGWMAWIHRQYAFGKSGITVSFLIEMLRTYGAQSVYGSDIPLAFGIDGVLYARPIAGDAAIILAIIFIRREMKKMDALVWQNEA